MKIFPTNVFPDVERDAFKKFSKKNVTEDYIKENLRNMGWSCYSPFTDTGLDILATKEVNGKTIYRYIQVKTRALDSKNHFGYTLKSKDFETDCRKFFFLYCDTVDDVIIMSMYDYLKICIDNPGLASTHFTNVSFRNNNNKLNSLTCSVQEDEKNIWTWSYGKGKNSTTINFDDYLNENGLKKMDLSIWDTDTNKLNCEISRMKTQLFYQYRKSEKNEELFNDNTGQQIDDFMHHRVAMKPINYIIENNSIKTDFMNNNPELYESHRRYLIDDLLTGEND